MPTEESQRYAADLGANERIPDGDDGHVGFRTAVALMCFARRTALSGPPRAPGVKRPGQRFKCRLLATVIGLCLGLIRLSAGTPGVQNPQPPVFTARTDVVTVDVAVLDKNGAPVPDLRPGDFSVVVEKQPRRVLSADYIDARSRRSDTPPASGLDATPAATTNAAPIAGRTFLFVVDVDEIQTGSGGVALRFIGDYLDRLGADDRVGIVAFPSGPRVDLTTNRRQVRDAASLIFGASHARNPVDPTEMSVGEAAAIERYDRAVLDAYLQRLRQNPCTNNACLQAAQARAERLMDQERVHSRQLLSALKALAEALGPIDGPKTLVLVSEGVAIGLEMQAFLQDFADAAARARVTLYALNLDVPMTLPSDSNSSPLDRGLDHRVLFDGMADIAAAARGMAFLISGTPAGALQRIDAELSGYYLVAFQHEPADRDNHRAAIDVRVNRPDLVVRARPHFTPGPVTAAKPSTGAVDVKAGIGALLRWPVPVGELKVDIDAFSTFAPAEGHQIRTMIVADIATSRAVISGAGFEVSTETGTLVADSFKPRPTLRTLADGHGLYVAAATLPPGKYTIKFATIDDDGHRGSVEHTFEVRALSAGALQIGDLFIGEDSADGFRPLARVAPGTSRLAVRVDLQADSAGAFSDASVQLRLTSPGKTTPAIEGALAMGEGDSPLKRFAGGTVPIDGLEPGYYVVEAVVRTRDGLTQTVSRGFQKF